MSVPFVHDTRVRYGESIAISPLIRCVTARNPGPYTYTGTGTYIIGHGAPAVIDPGPLLDGHIAALLAALKGETVSHILVTHTHIDHSPAAKILAQQTGAKIYAFGPHGSGKVIAGFGDKVEEGADKEFTPDIFLKDRETVSGAGWTIEVLHTPGHTSNHTCYALLEEKALFTGDHIMGWATTVISPPDGDMAAYLASLRKLLDRGDGILYPTHGPPVENPKSFIRALIAHRNMRAGQILSVLGNNPSTIGGIVERLYASTPKNLHAAAARSVLAHLIDLTQQGRVACGAPLSAESIFSLV